MRTTVPAAATWPPHRGVLILVPDILSLVLCFLIGFVAWLLGES